MYSPAQPQLIVVLLDAQAQPGAIVEAYARQRVRVVPLERFDIPEGKVLQVWTLPGPATGPVSLGLLEGARDDADQPRSAFAAAGAKGFARAPQI
jgi:anti-sigma-K factor RskA